MAVLGELPGAEDGVASAQREQQLARALDELPGDQLELVRLSFFYGMSHVEIERKVGLPIGTIKSRIRRALQRLRMTLNSKL